MSPNTCNPSLRSKHLKEKGLGDEFTDSGLPEDLTPLSPLLGGEGKYSEEPGVFPCPFRG